MKKILVILLFLFLITGCDKSSLEVIKDGDNYIYKLEDIELKSKVDIYKYIDKDDNFNYKG